MKQGQRAGGSSVFFCRYMPLFAEILYNGKTERGRGIAAPPQYSIRFKNSYLRANVVPAGVSVSTMPCAASSARILSASA